MISREVLGKRAFARPMKKREGGVYVRIRIAIDPSQLDALCGRYTLSEEVFRVQIVKGGEVKQEVAEPAAEEGGDDGES